MAVTIEQHAPDRGEIDTLAGNDVGHAGEHVGLVRPCRPRAAPATACSWVTPAGSCLLTAPEKIKLVARARIFGAATLQATLTTASRMTMVSIVRSGRSLPRSLLNDLLKFLAFSPEPMRLPCMEPGPSPRRRPAPRAADGPPAGGPVPARLTGRSLLRRGLVVALFRAHATSSALNCEYTISW